ncbi:nicotinate-nucleotide adenylyltransferase NadD [Gottschalkia acidurici 9a]|uniref:Probable nicotinate-nucleotide adenylyltransferase n=1 Tax=Gottschalkia acidurici (strain ATCC 7906 / DSM 604 / BCRC 14475 / CIP 104303 / KCTC 5404 / NCIMB 10678 / 9a) TaxID=1128398 RepID=K0B1L6_GOTA9|nr:nicotinate-nucleotide adenylyltransferase [Gottschalkia acidurici]AFS78982.1 nicotinate-nucleotide adenylyltransferase NadD [Gottschalkia acidurici 9a]
MEKKKKRYGIMGGTFDPIHTGHLVVAEEVRQEFNLDKVIFMPTGDPPHKSSKEVALGQYRYEMTLLATVTNPFFEVSRLELDRKGTTYTIDTMITLKEKYKDDVEFYFITGADSLLELHTWKDSDKILELCKIVAATRPGYDLGDMEERLKELNEDNKESINTITTPGLQISSTDIRHRVKNGMTIKYLLPESVEVYIEKYKLYK